MLQCTGGKGGDGGVVFSKHGPHRLLGPGLPVGGAGGRGGNVYAAPMGKHDNRADLRHIPGSVRAPGGLMGSYNAAGKSGNDVILKVPLGTLIYRFDRPPHDEPDKGWREVCGTWKRTLVADINEPTHENVILARGGRGGHGNTMRSVNHSLTNTKVNRSPYEAEYGGSPEEEYYEIELKSIADIGLIGLPNVGKSTLLSAMTRANSRIAAYPFTTLAPCIGHIRFTDGQNISVADLPGIVECRLTQEFFRHIERTKALLYVIDVCNTTYDSMEETFASLREQVKAHGTGLANKPFVIVATKMDVNPSAAARSVDEFCQYLRTMKVNTTVIPTSAKFGLGVVKLVRVVRNLVEEFAQTLADRVNNEDCGEG
ncbi:Obg family GTPase [Babesia ovis]|uniref:Obg family GTPase n=1 Tax=Babesia ovis TaxID=5869 RepID=A0A9W5T7X4_BABOV|nr:Obg family GTPase [Babesia ovis]